MTELATPSTTPWIRFDAGSIVVHAEAGVPPRYSITGEVALPPGLAIERGRLLALGRVGERIVAHSDTSLDLENLSPEGSASTASASESRTAFEMSISGAGVLDAIELRASLRCNVLLGAARVPTRDIPSSADLSRAPARAPIGDGHVTLSLRIDQTDTNIDVCGLVAGDVPGFVQGRVEFVCLDRDGAPLFRDDSMFEPGFGAPVAYRVTAWPKNSLWQVTETLMLRVRAEVAHHAPALVIAARDFRRDVQDSDASA